MAFQTFVWIFVLTLFDTLRNFSVSAGSYCSYSYYYFLYSCIYYKSSYTDPGITPGVVVYSINGFFIIVVVVVVICVKKQQRSGVAILPSTNVTSVDTTTTAHNAQPGYGPPAPDHGPSQTGRNPYGPPPGAEQV